MSDEAKTYDAAISDLGDKLAGLTLKDAVDLADYMKDTYGIEAAAGGGVVMAAAADGGGAAAEEQTEFAVVLKALGGNKIGVIKAVREITGLGLKEAKEMAETAGVKVKEGLGKEEADEVAGKLKDAGAEVEIA